MAKKPMAEIQLEGMRELRRGLRQFDNTGDWKQHLKGAYREVADDVAGEARRRAGSRSAPRMGRVAVNSMKAHATTTYGGIKAGRNVPWYKGHEFGSHRYRQFPPAKKGGYNIYPTIGDRRDEIAEQFSKSVDAALERAFE